jgi:hypothetical protein
LVMHKMSFEVKRIEEREARKASLWPLLLLLAFAICSAWSLEPALMKFLAP